MVFAFRWVVVNRATSVVAVVDLTLLDLLKTLGFSGWCHAVWCGRRLRTHIDSCPCRIPAQRTSFPARHGQAHRHTFCSSGSRASSVRCEHQTRILGTLSSRHRKRFGVGLVVGRAGLVGDRVGLVVDWVGRVVVGRSWFPPLNLTFVRFGFAGCFLVCVHFSLYYTTKYIVCQVFLPFTFPHQKAEFRASAWRSA